MINSKIRLISSAIFCFLIGSACSNREQADAIFISGTIYTVNTNFDVKEAMAIKDGKILAVGSNDDILNHYESTNTTDLHKLAVYPGFIDGHTHFIRYALGLQNIDLIGTKSFNEVVEKIQEHVDKYPDTKWVVGHGWDQNDWDGDKAFPTKDTLDLLFPDKVIVLSRVDAHAVLTNQNGLDLINIKANTKIDGGEVVVVRGKASGVLVDAAAKLLRNKIPDVALTTKQQLLQQAQANCFAVGLSSIAEAGLEKGQVDLLSKLQKDSLLSIRIYAMLNPSEENINYYFSNGHYKTDRLNVRSFKIYGDGALGSRGACLIHPYHDKENAYGFLLNSPAVFDSLARSFMLKNFQMNTHAIGDSTNRLITDIYAKYLKGRNDKRWRIEHAQVVHPSDMSKFSQYNILPSVQPTHATSDMAWAADRLGKDRVKNAYAYKRLLAANEKIILGSDFPVEDINPLFGFHAAVSRQNEKDEPESGYMIEESISRADALKGMTIWAAFGQFEEKEKGSLAAGKLADFVILDQDLMTVPQEKLRATKVMQTWLGGKKVYQLQ